MISLAEVTQCSGGCESLVASANLLQVAMVGRNVDNLQLVSSVDKLFVRSRFCNPCKALMNYLRIPLREAFAFERLTVIVTLSLCYVNFGALRRHKGFIFFHVLIWFVKLW